MHQHIVVGVGRAEMVKVHVNTADVQLVGPVKHHHPAGGFGRIVALNARRQAAPGVLLRDQGHTGSHELLGVAGMGIMVVAGDQHPDRQVRQPRNPPDLRHQRTVLPGRLAIDQYRAALAQAQQ